MSEPSERDREMAMQITGRGGAPARIEWISSIIAEAREEGRREAQAWRSVKDDPPPVNTSVLIWLPQWEHYGLGTAQWLPLLEPPR